MAIEYHLQQSRLTAIAGKYTARVISKATIDIEHLARDIVQTGLTISESEVKAVIEEACISIERHLLQGNRVQLGGIVNLGTSIKGVFDSAASDVYEPGFNAVEVTASAGKGIKKKISRNASIRRVAPPVHNPCITSFVDINIGISDSSIAAGNVATVRGLNLNFDAADPDQGLYFCDAAGSASDVKVTTIVNAGHKQITLQVPAAIANFTQCYLEVRRRHTPTGQLVSGKSVKLMIG